MQLPQQTGENKNLRENPNIEIFKFWFKFWLINFYSVVNIKLSVSTV